MFETPLVARWLGPLLLLVVLITALVIGSGVATARPLTNTQRADKLDATIRCPSCEDLSVAESSASSAIAVRGEVASLIAKGHSTSSIESTLVGQYGPTILLRPPDAGLSALVWDLPIGAGILSVLGVGVLFRRRIQALSLLRQKESSNA